MKRWRPMLSDGHPTDSYELTVGRIDLFATPEDGCGTMDGCGTFNVNVNVPRRATFANWRNEVVAELEALRDDINDAIATLMSAPAPRPNLAAEKERHK